MSLVRGHTSASNRSNMQVSNEVTNQALDDCHSSRGFRDSSDQYDQGIPAVPQPPPFKSESTNDGAAAASARANRSNNDNDSYESGSGDDEVEVVEDICDTPYINVNKLHKNSEKFQKRSKDTRPSMGTHMFVGGSTRKWDVVSTEHKDKVVYDTSLFAMAASIPKQCRKGATSKLNSKNSAKGGGFQGKARWQGYTPLNEELNNCYPTHPVDQAKQLRLWPFTGHLTPTVPTPQHVLGTRWCHDTESQKYCLHPEGCGHYLEEGMVVVCDGRETIHRAPLVYEISLFCVHKSLQRRCKVGIIRVLAPFLKHFVGRYYMVGYKSPQPNLDNKREFNYLVKGYFHLHLMNHTDVVPNIYYPAGEEVNCDFTYPFAVFDTHNPDLPTEDKFLTSKLKRKKRPREGEEEEGYGEESG